MSQGVPIRPRIYVVVGSHPCAAVEAALGWLSIDHDRVELPTLSQTLVGPFLFGGRTVPGMRLGRERIVGSRAIVARLEPLAAEGSLLPSDDDSRAKVIEAERWGEEVFQNEGRQILDAAFLSRPAAMASFAAEAKVQVPETLLRPILPLAARILARRSGTDDRSARAALSALPERLDRIDLWIAEGLLGGDSPNRADLQIGSTVRLLATIADLSLEIRQRPAGGLLRYFPPSPGEVGPGALNDVAMLPGAAWRP